MRCIFCKNKLKNKIVEHKEFGVSLGKFSAKVCVKCKEIFFEKEVVDKIQLKSKELGLFGLKKTVKIAKVGNSLAIRIPKRISEFLKLKSGEETSLYPEGDKLIIETKE